MIHRGFILQSEFFLILCLIIKDVDWSYTHVNIVPETTTLMRQSYAMQSIYYQTIPLCSIAFKPAESGWGGGSKYTKNFDSIFGSKKKDDGDATKKDGQVTAEKGDDKKKN